jgi:hypothetical protein
VLAIGFIVLATTTDICSARQQCHGEREASVLPNPCKNPPKDFVPLEWPGDKSPTRQDRTKIKSNDMSIVPERKSSQKYLSY